MTNFLTNIVSQPTNQETHGEYHWLKLLIGALPIAGFVLGYFTHWLAIRRDVKGRIQKAKDEFGLFVREQRNAVPQYGVREFYDRTKPTIKAAVDRIWHFLGDTDRTRLDRLWKEYDDIPYKDLSADNEPACMASLNKLFDSECQHPKDVLKFYLDEFYKFSA